MGFMPRPGNYAQPNLNLIWFRERARGLFSFLLSNQTWLSVPYVNAAP